MNYTPNALVSVPKKDDLAASNKIGAILANHGLKLTYYGSNGVGFYKKTNEDKVPVYSRFFLDRKEFHLLLDKLEEIAELKLKLEDVQYRFTVYQEYMDKTR